MINTNTHDIFIKGTKRAVNAVSTMSESDQQVILTEHNKYRKMVSPTASNMRKMVGKKTYRRNNEQHEFYL